MSSYNSGYSVSNEHVSHSHHMQMQINETNDESVASTRRMLSHLNEADGAATDTMANLDEQRQQLNRIDRNMATIDEEVREAQKNLTALEKFCGLCTCPCRKPSKLKAHKSDRNNAYTVAVHSNGGTRNTPSTHTTGTGGGGYINRVTGDAREDEIDENLDEVSAYLKGLKMKALAIGDEVEAQNEMIDVLSEKAVTNEENIKRSNQQANRVIKNN